MKRLGTGRLPVTFALAAAVPLAAVALAAVAPAPARAAEGQATAAITRAAAWSTGYVASVAIRNGAGTALVTWRVEFDLPAGASLSSVWGATYTRTGDHYTFRNASWAGNVPPGGTATFGFNATGTGLPLRCTLNGAPCGGQPPTDVDTVPPTAPTNARTVTNEGLWLEWDAATDDRGAVTYEVLESGMPYGTATEPRLFITSGILPPKLFIWAIRAVDAAGNRSPLAYAALGNVSWTDVTPAAPANPRVAAADASVVRLAWDANFWANPYANAPIAGYEVAVDGTPVSRVGAGEAALPAPGPGLHTYSVRAFTALGTYSPAAVLVH
ncbi:cellulose binding domain-containing protein [Rhizomonospora bruguierae]|uniref:cellulose binding domain-containing protein n=1 Tax=Rhizomonospora bruguierae TaxID=1581705 RepID=UPI001BCE84F6|nr:cellulose binding domain-containing protein [Micromonospora sp. NBRC 107566]